MNLKFIPVLFFPIFLGCPLSWGQGDGLLIYDSVLSESDNWVLEIRDESGGNISFSENKIEIDVSEGATIWFKEKLEGSVVIEYDATVIENGGPNDRVSDLNCFWMFSDPNEKDGNLRFGKNNRNGKFSNYHKLQGYYVGLGGHNNTRTRFRRYDGQFNRKLFPEHDLTDKKYLITPNKKYNIQLVVCGNNIEYIRDGETIFKWKDEQALKSGWFAFRTVQNHMVIENFSVRKLIPIP